jgi:hypothetical protein
VAKYVEIVPPPAEVDLAFYDPKHPHISVAPADKYDDPRVVGVALTGLDKQLTYVCRGDAVITYPDGTVVVKSRDEALAYFEPKREPKTKSKPAAPALPEKFEEVDLDKLLAGTDEGDEK